MLTKSDEVMDDLKSVGHHFESCFLGFPHHGNLGLFLNAINTHKFSILKDMRLLKDSLEDSGLLDYTWVGLGYLTMLSRAYFRAVVGYLGSHEWEMGSRQLLHGKLEIQFGFLF